MRDFIWYAPTEVAFGHSALEHLPELVRKYGGTRVLLVYGSGSAVRSGLIDRVQTLLSGTELTPFGGVKANPTVGKAREGVAKALEIQADLILAVGGGSAIDTAKAIAHGAATSETDLWDWWLQKEPLRRSLPVGAVLTIPASGSETSDSAVLTNEATGEKRGLNTPFNRPAFAIMDPALAATLPKFQVACGVVDILMHTLDRYLNVNDDNDTSDAIAGAVLQTVLRHGPAVYADAGNYHAMSEIMWCGSLSHNGLTGAGGNFDFSTHRLGHELSGKFDVAHGASLSAVWGHFARYACARRPQRFVRLAEEVLGIPAQADPQDTARLGIEKLEQFFHELNMPLNFTELGIGVQEEAVIEDLALRCSRQKTITVGNLYPLAYEDMKRIYSAANQ